MSRFCLKISKRWAVSLMLLCVVVIASLAIGIPGLEPDPENQPTAWATTPTDPETLRSLQKRVQLGIRSALPSVVAIAGSPTTEKRGAFENYASGVIITAEGLILSQAHVSHDLEFPGRSPVPQFGGQPGERVKVVVSDGRRLQAELLGADPTYDISLLQLLTPGPYPHSPLDPAAQMNLGDWVIKLGHPMGYRRDRPAVARLGRVLLVRNDVLVTDCSSIGGDSGGPFFDLEGRLVGILGCNAAPPHISDALSTPDHSHIGPWTAIPNQLIQQSIKQMLGGQLIPFNESAFDKHFNGSHSYRWAKDGMLPRKQWTQGRVTVNAVQDVIQDARRSVVAILDDAERVVAHGTIVNAQGQIVTLASTLPEKPRCRLSTSSQEDPVAAQIVGKDPAFDLAILRVPVNGLPAIRWTKGPPEAGTLLAAVGMSETALGIGIVSVPQRNLAGPPRTDVMRLVPYEPHVNPHDPAAQTYAERPAFYGRLRSQRYLVNMAAPDTGLQPGDWLLSINGRNIQWESDIINSCARLTPRERVPVSLIRDGQRQQLNADLSPVPMHGSRGYAKYPTLFEHDIPLCMSPLGNPVVDLNGDAIGITVYRSDYGCLAIPSDCILRLAADLRD